MAAICGALVFPLVSNIVQILEFYTIPAHRTSRNTRVTTPFLHTFPTKGMTATKCEVTFVNIAHGTVFHLCGAC